MVETAAMALAALVGLALGWGLGALAGKGALWLALVIPLLTLLVVLWLALVILRPLVGA
ncbi:hypothetical protein D3C86_1269350 [compost metagenome]